MKAPALLSPLLLLATLVPAYADDVRILLPESIEFKSDPSIPTVGIAVVSGNPKDGAYTIRARIAQGTKIQAHFHPDTRTVTVLSGAYSFGSGDRFDDGALKAYRAGTVIVVPAGTPHFSASPDGEAIVQESGTGPTGLTLTGK